MAILVSSTKEDLALAYAAEVTHVAIHTADPGTTGTSELTSVSRLPITWLPGSVDGVVQSDTLDFSVPADTTVAYLGFWSQATGGEFKDAMQVGVAFVSAGHYVISIQFTVT